MDVPLALESVAEPDPEAPETASALTIEAVAKAPLPLSTTDEAVGYVKYGKENELMKEKNEI